MRARADFRPVHGAMLVGDAMMQAKAPLRPFGRLRGGSCRIGTLAGPSFRARRPSRFRPSKRKHGHDADYPGVPPNLGCRRAMTVRVLAIDDGPDVSGAVPTAVPREVREGFTRST